MDTLWFGTGKDVDITAVTIPFLRHELIINMGDVFDVSHSCENNNILFSAIRIQAMTTVVKGNYHAVGILFHPIGIYETFGLSVAELYDSDKLLFGRHEELATLINARDTPYEKLEALASFLARNSAKKQCPTVVTDFFKAISAMAGKPAEIRKIARQMNFSSKHLISTFRDVVGITPKKYLQLMQLNCAIWTMIARPTKKLTEIALEHDFYDQSHFIRVFRAWSGMTPYTFRAQRLAQSHSFSNTLIL